MKKIPVLLLVLLVILSGCAKEAVKEEETNQEKKQYVIYAEITVKDYGTIKVELYPDIAPKTVDNFIKNVNNGIYENNTFHRIIDGFMIQGGADRTGTAEKLEGEFSSNGFENNLKHTTGVISMARASDPDSATSQFFIMVGDASWLDGEYAAFGKVTDGLDIVLKIASDANPIDNNGTIPVNEQPVIECIEILND